MESFVLIDNKIGRVIDKEKITGNLRIHTFYDNKTSWYLKGSIKKLDEINLEGTKSLILELQECENRLENIRKRTLL